jgi:two-component system, OmpR family, response regulator
MTTDLDFTTHFNPETKMPEPVYTEPELKHLDDLGVIGESALKDTGFYTRIVSARQSVSPKLPADTSIFVVEDDVGTATVIQRALQKSGYQTSWAKNRGEIIKCLSAMPRPDLILLDVLLPDINGFDLLNRLRQHNKFQSTPIIILTSLRERKDVTKGLGLGADGYLTKPVLPTTLVDAVEAVLTG